MNASDALDCRNAVAFEQEAEHQLRLLDRQVHAVQNAIAGIREYFAALRALVSLAAAEVRFLGNAQPAHLDLLKKYLEVAKAAMEVDVAKNVAKDDEVPLDRQMD